MILKSPSKRRLKKHLMGILGILVLTFCSSQYNRPLVERGISDEERRFYIIQNGYGIPLRVRKAFLEGHPVVGMSQDLVFQLYGAPDRNREDDTVWEYVNRRGELVTGLEFQADTLVRIYGDPSGGENPSPQP